MIIKTNDDKFVINCKTHDLLFSNLLFENNKLSFSLGDGNRTITRIDFNSVVFLKADKIIPDGIVLSCYDFNILCPPCSADLPDLIKIKKDYLISESARVFYCDGSRGLDFMIIYEGDSFVFVE